MSGRSLAKIAWRLALALGGVGLVIWIGIQNLPPSGTLVTSARPGEANPFISILRPEDRVRLVTDAPLRYVVTGDPTYFELAMPRFFHQVTLTLEYRVADAPIVEVGPHLPGDAWGFALKTLDLPALDKSGWSVRTDGPYRIYERRATSLSLTELFRRRATNQLAVWHVDPADFGQPNKKFVAWSRDLDLKRSGLETVVVSGYVPPQDLGDGWKRAAITFDRGELTLRGDSVQFALSVPSLGRGGAAPAVGSFEVRLIEAEYRRPPLISLLQP